MPGATVVVVGRRGLVLAVTAAGLGALGGAGMVGGIHIPRPATLCPLRATTGIPCPICGTTTALARLGRFDPVGALAANPVTVLGLVALVLAPLFAARLPRPSRTVRAPLAGLVIAFAWAWQLARFDVFVD